VPVPASGAGAPRELSHSPAVAERRCLDRTVLFSPGGRAGELLAGSAGGCSAVRLGWLAGESPVCQVLAFFGEVGIVFMPAVSPVQS